MEKKMSEGNKEFSKINVELDDNELDNIAGGDRNKDGKLIVTHNHSCDKFCCADCWYTFSNGSSLNSPTEWDGVRYGNPQTHDHKIFIGTIAIRSTCLNCQYRDGSICTIS